MANKSCTAINCNKIEQLRRGFCNQHYRNWRNFGNPNRRTTRTPNDYRIINGVAQVYLYDRFGKVRAVTLVDEADLPEIIKFKWSWSDGYAKTRSTGVTKQMAWFLLNPPKGMECDHINRNRLDNRRVNLRVATPHQNMLNRGIRSDNKSGHRGVCYAPDKQKWLAYIAVDKKQVKLGQYDTKVDALVARLKMEEALGWKLAN